MYVEIECPGVNEGDAADRAAAALFNVSLSGQQLVVELRPGTPFPAGEGDPRMFVLIAEHLSHALGNGRLVLRRREPTEP
jgi:hypothetical protein